MKSKKIFRVSSLVTFALLLFVLLVLAQSFAEDCQGARVYFQQALNIKHQPDDMKALLQKERMYRKAVELCPSYAEAHNNLADVYENLGRYAEAIEEYKKTVELRKDQPYPYFGLGDIYFKNGNYEEAISWYDNGLKLQKEKDPVSLELRKQAHDLLHKKAISKEKEVIPEEKIVQVLARPQILTRGPGEPVKITFNSDPRKKGLGLIPFDYDKSDIREDAKPQLQELGKALTSSKLSEYAFEIGGHTDIRGSEAYNVELSQKRATAVKNYLEENFAGTKGRLKAKGYGKYRIIAIGNDEASHAINRRVEILRLDRIGEGVKEGAKEGVKEEATEGGTAGSAKVTLSLDAGFLYQDGRTGKPNKISTDGKTVLRTGKDPYQIFFRPHQTCYVYLLQKDAAGKWSLLFPQKSSDFNKNPVQSGKDYWIPRRDEGFPLDETSGEETIYLLASQWEMTDLDSAGPG